MKKRISKALETLAKSLPASYIKRKHTETAPLWQMYRKIDEGHDIKGLPELTEENRDSMFDVTYDVVEVLNHHRRLKKVFTDKKEKGVQEYLLWVKHHNDRWIKKYGQGEALDPKLFEIAKMKIASFWKTLIVFLFSFAATFQKTSDDQQK